MKHIGAIVALSLLAGASGIDTSGASLRGPGQAASSAQAPM